MVDKQRVDRFLEENKKRFPKDKLVALKDKLEKMDESQFARVSSTKLKSPTSTFFVSLFLGELGIDRFMVGDVGLGILKLLTLGCCGILYIIDWFVVPKKAKEKNFNNIMMTV